jgi:hypothetical protein
MSKPSKQFLGPKPLMLPAGYSHIAKVNRGNVQTDAFTGRDVGMAESTQMTQLGHGLAYAL